MKTSIIIITRNRAKMLKRCLNSLVKQMRLPDKVIVVDTPTDNTKEVALSFKKKLPIKYVVEKQIGIPYARNKGLQLTTGELILMLDDDCEADKYWIEEMIKAHQKYPKAWVIQGRTFSLPKNGLYSITSEFIRLLYTINYTSMLNPLRTFPRKYFTEDIKIFTCATINFSVKNSFIKKNNLSFDTNFYRGEDTDFGRQILEKNGLIVFCPSAVVAHHERSTLYQFLQQQWHIGITNAKLAKKWKGLSAKTKLSWLEKFIFFPVFCKVISFRKLHKIPAIIFLLLLVKIHRLLGYFFEKGIISLNSYFSKQ